MTKYQAFRELDDISIQHKVQFRADEALLIGDTRELIKQINSIIPRMEFGGDNPNNGKRHQTFDIGREYSRVVYLSIIKTYMPKDFDYAKLNCNLIEIAKKFGADEFNLERSDSSCFVFRFWWD